MNHSRPNEAHPAAPPSIELWIEQTDVDDQTVLALRGELDKATAPRLAQAVSQVHARGVQTLILDLEALEFIDSSGLNEFVAALKRQRSIGGDVLLRSPTQQTQRVLEIVGLDQVFKIT